MVIDRLLLWIFSFAFFIGTFGILLRAPSIYDERYKTKISNQNFENLIFIIIIKEKHWGKWVKLSNFIILLLFFFRFYFDFYISE